jgi:hypothetical protein
MASQFTFAPVAQRPGTNQRRTPPPDSAEPEKVDAKKVQRKLEPRFSTPDFIGLLCGGQGLRLRGRLLRPHLVNHAPEFGMMRGTPLFPKIRKARIRRQQPEPVPHPRP